METTAASMSADPGNWPVAATLALVCGLAGPGAAVAQDDEAAPGAPDLALLEYLGSWEESDEEWVLLSEREGDAGEQDESGDAAADIRGSEESDHES